MMPWRRMRPQDLQQVQALADAIHVDHPEDMDVLAERQNLYPQGCYVLLGGDRLIGYALSHPWRFGEPPALNSRLGALPRIATTYYIHDVALLPEGRGQGYAADLAERLVEHAREASFSNLSLVAVNQSRPFWEGLDFRAETIPGLDEKLLSYGPDAVLMARSLARENA